MKCTNLFGHRFDDVGEHDQQSYKFVLVILLPIVKVLPLVSLALLPFLCLSYLNLFLFLASSFLLEAQFSTSLLLALLLAR